MTYSGKGGSEDQGRSKTAQDTEDEHEVPILYWQSESFPEFELGDVDGYLRVQAPRRNILAQIRIAPAKIRNLGP
jgi:hypothetical protein